MCETCYWANNAIENAEKNALKELEEPETKQPSKKYEIPKKSKKQKVLDGKYAVLRIEFLGKKENQICPITGQKTTEIHHKWSGKDRAKYFLETSTWLAVSRNGHSWIHENPKESRELGFLN